MWSMYYISQIYVFYDSYCKEQSEQLGLKYWKKVSPVGMNS